MGGQDRQVLERRLVDVLTDVALEEPEGEALLEEACEVGARLRRLGRQQIARRAGLGIDVDEQGAEADGGAGRGQVTRDRRLADAALLVEDDPAHTRPLRPSCYFVAVPTSRVVASLAPAGAGVRARISMERDSGSETIRDVKAPNVWAALKELLVVQSLHETEGAQSLELSLDQGVVDRALATPAAEKALAANHLHSVDVGFTSDGIVVGVVAQLGPLKLPRRQYTIGVAARRGNLELDLSEVLGIPIVGSKIATVLDSKAAEFDFLTVRRRDHRLTVGSPRIRCERATARDE